MPPDYQGRQVWIQRTLTRRATRFLAHEFSAGKRRREAFETDLT
jgi:hypothetical protein